MKWAMVDAASEKEIGIPSNSISRKSTGRFISALLYYSMKKRKHESCERKQAEKSVALPENRGNGFSSSESHQQAKKTRTSITREELSAIQTQLAILSDGDGDRPIHIAVANENLKLIKKLCLLMLQNSISLDITNCLRQTPLHLAVVIGNTEIIQMLLSFGASPLVCDRNGNSILHLAVKSHENKEVLQLLLTHSQVKNRLDSMDYEGYTALHYAVFKKNTNAVKLLQTSGADMNKIDGKSGRTALIHAVLEHNTEMVDLLLNCGACPQKMDYSGRSALEMALQIANLQIVKLLEKCMPHNEITAIKEQIKPNITKTKRTKN